MVTVMIEEPPLGQHETHGRVTVVSGMFRRVLVGQPQAVVLRMEVVVQVARPPAQVSQTST